MIKVEIYYNAENYSSEVAVEENKDIFYFFAALQDSNLVNHFTVYGRSPEYMGWSKEYFTKWITCRVIVMKNFMGKLENRKN